MLESASWSLSASPILVSPMSDPATITNLCLPFLDDADIADPLQLALCQTNLIPSLKKSILNREVSKLANVPKLMKVMIDNFGGDGLSMVVGDILPAIVHCYLQSSAEGVAVFQDLYLNVVSSIPSRLRDDVLVDIIHDFAGASDAKLRILAIHVITLVRRPGNVASVFKDLATDHSAHVRAEAVMSLPNCNFDVSLVEYVITRAARDSSFHVRNSAAEVFGTVAPRMMELYLELLTSAATMEKALNSFVLVVEVCGLEPLVNAFALAVRTYPEKCARVIVECAVKIDVCQHRLLFRCAKMLRHIPEFVSHLHDLSLSFETKVPFLKLFCVSRMKTWREKVLYAQQAVLFVEYLGCDMLEVAADFAADENAAVRNESVNIFVAIYQQDQTIADSISALLQATWHLRLILAKVISEAKLPLAFWDAAKLLANDPCENVRSCLARGVQNTPYFNVFFKDSECGDNKQCL